MRTLKNTNRAAMLLIGVLSARAIAAEVGPGTFRPIACEAGVTNAVRLNAMDLFSAAGACFRDQRELESSFLLITGQLRASADMEFMTPSGDDDRRAVGELYGFIFYRAGGAGSARLFRDEKETDRLFAMIRSWQPELGEEYDPGWAYRRRPDEKRYFASMDFGRTVRLLQLSHYAQLLRDEAYYAAYVEDAEIQRRNDGMLTEGTPDYERSTQLHAVMAEISRSHPEPEFPKPPPYQFTPDPEATYRHILSGFNGQHDTDSTIVWTRDEAMQSWLAQALSKRELAGVLEQVDFANEFMLVHSVGKRTNVTGTLHVVDMDTEPADNTFSVAVMIGVNEEGCAWPEADSYPFAVVVTRKTPQRAVSRGYYHGNFGDGCRKPASGRPIPAGDRDPP